MGWFVARGAGGFAALGRVVVVLAATVGLLGLSAVLASRAAAALPSNCSQSGSAVTCSFSSTGSEQTFTVPAGVSSVTGTAVGGRGGTGFGTDSGSSGGAGGFGADVTGTLSVSGGETLYVEVARNAAGAAGGFNGGAAGTAAFFCGTVTAAGGGGGGASDVRTTSSSTSGSLGSRLLVAAGGGGGGGGGSHPCASDTGPGGGGGPAGLAGNGPAGGGGGGGAGTATTGGAGGTPETCPNCGAGANGTLGAGGIGGHGDAMAGGGGGGGNYGGGGGGGAGRDSGGGGGGGGGSNLVPAGGSAATDTTGTPSVSLSYTAPTASITTPADGATYTLGQAVNSSFTCTDVPGGPGIQSCVDQNGKPSGTPVDTSTPGSHTVTVTATDTNGLVGQGSVTYTVNPAPLTITASSVSMVYGASVPQITPSYAGFVNGDTAASLTSQPTCTTTATSPSHVGTYHSRCSGASDPNYTITYAPGTVRVNPAPLTITASSASMSYGGSAPQITSFYSGFVNGDTAASLTTAPTCATTATSSSTVARSPYLSTCSGASDPDYKITYVPGAVTVNPAPLTITASSPSMRYGASVPQITPGYAGFVNGDSASSLTRQPTCSTSATSSSPVGTYPSSCSGASDPNYTITYLRGTVTVNPAPLTITASSPSIGYGASVPQITPGYAGFVNGDSASSLTRQPACSTGATSSSPVGTYPSSCAGASDPNYTITYVRGTVTVAKASQTITFSPLASTAAARTSAALSAAGGGSAQPVTFSVAAGTSPGDACRVSQAGSGSGTVTFAHVGTCVIDADQAPSSDGNYSAAPTVSQTVNVQAAASQMTLPNPTTVVFGQPTTVTATVSEADQSTPSGTVQFGLDGQNLGGPVAVGMDGRGLSPDLERGDSLAPGAHTLSATFTPADTSVYAPISSSRTQTVNQAASATGVAVKPSTITATVAAVAPGAGTPTGTVIFSVDGSGVGSATLSNGTATLGYSVPPGKTHQVAAVYSGDSDFTGSSASTSRIDPTIAAQLLSSHAKTRYGWYRSPVTVTFTCTTDGAPLTAACPSEVRLAASGAGQSVTRTISATNGGAATAVVSGIDIDQTKPTVKLTGIRPGDAYDGTAPTARCQAKDSLSGIAWCTLRHHETTSDRGLDVTTVRYTARATSRAGNTTTASATYRLLGVYLEGARYEHGRFLVAPGRTYTIVVERSALRPRYIDAAPSTASPAGNDQWFASVGPRRWAQGVTISDALARRFKEWVLGVQIGSALHDLDVQIS